MSEVDERLKKDIGVVGRRSRGEDDRHVTENRVLSEDDRLEMFRMNLHNSALPDLPEIPGYHVCWLTSTNSRDSIHHRMQLGYEPVRPDDVPGLEYATLKTGEWSGFVATNEMLAFKLPLSLYRKFMQEAHHDAPSREDEKLTSTADFLRQQAQSTGSTLIEGDGLQSLRQSSPAKGIFA
jgi:hypothetical protein